MIKPENCILLIIDLQERLVSSLDKDIVVKRSGRLADGARILGIPTIATEQYPKGLGHTLPILSEKFAAGTPIIEKTSFSAVRENGFLEKIKSYNKNQVVICGIETHICVYQTAVELIEAGFEVYVAKDACASRNKFEFKEGIDRMIQNGAKSTCVEIVLFEWLGSAKNQHFKEVQALIK